MLVVGPKKMFVRPLSTSSTNMVHTKKFFALIYLLKFSRQGREGANRNNFKCGLGWFTFGLPSHQQLQAQICLRVLKNDSIQ